MEGHRLPHSLGALIQLLDVISSSVRDKLTAELAPSNLADRTTFPTTTGLVASLDQPRGNMIGA